MSQHENHSVEDEHIESATPNPSPLEKVRQHQQETEQSLQQHSQNVEQHPDNNQAEVPGQGVPSDMRHHPQRSNR